MKREWLINKRKVLKLTQQDIAKEAFMDRGYYSQIENGKRNPSPEVAYNIAKALDFDPMMFFQYQNRVEKEQSHKITDQFKTMNMGKIVYLYNEMNLYLNNLVTFVTKGLEIKSHCLVIDSPENLVKLKKKVYDNLPKFELDQYLLLINKKEFIDLSFNEAINRFLSIIDNYDQDALLRVWSPKDTTEEYVKREENIENHHEQLYNRKILYVSSYNANTLSASDHINMMRHFQYIMTDEEIVESPLFDPNNKFILPSLFIQENI